MLLKCTGLECASTRQRAERACLIATPSTRPEGKHGVEVHTSGCGYEDRGGWIGVKEFGRGWGKYRTPNLRYRSRRGVVL